MDYQRDDDAEFFAGLAQGTGTEGRALARVALTVSNEGRRFTLADGAEVALTRRRAMRLLLLRLVDERLARPGAPLTVEELLAAGWPGERVLPAAGHSRVYVAVSTLRRLGLSGLLLHTGTGYLLDPAQDVRRV